MSLPRLEPFSSALSGWTQTAFSIRTLDASGGQGKASAGDGAHDILAFDSSNTYNDDQYAQAKCITISSGVDYVNVMVRASGTGATAKHYQFGTDGGSGSTHTSIYRVTAGEVYTLKQDIATTFAANDVIRLEVQGTTLRAYKNGSQVGTDSTDSTITSGSAGCGVYNNTGAAAALDDWEGGNLAAGGANPKGPFGNPFSGPFGGPI